MEDLSVGREHFNSILADATTSSTTTTKKRRFTTKKKMTEEGMVGNNKASNGHASGESNGCDVVLDNVVLVSLGDLGTSTIPAPTRTHKDDDDDDNGKQEEEGEEEEERFSGLCATSPPL